MKYRGLGTGIRTVGLLCAVHFAGMQSATAEPLPGGTLDPLAVPKYVTPLVIPPVMRNSNIEDDYDIAMRQFKQQILPAGFPPTTVWSYGPDADPTPAVAPDPNSQFNYPAYTIEARVNREVTVDWINGLVDKKGKYLPHLFAVDRTLHWANPERLKCEDTGEGHQDCRPAARNGQKLFKPYKGPVPIVTHVHGAHTGPESDGYPEAWWLPDAKNIPGRYARLGTLANNFGPSNTQAGVGSFSYPNDQPSTTLWYHDHALGITRLNVYAGPAGFWLIREEGGGETGLLSGTLPGPAPAPGESLLDTLTERSKYREIPIVIQDRSFNADGSLFYPANRAFFEGLGDGQVPSQAGNTGAIPPLEIPAYGTDRGRVDSDVSPIWNPEAFFNVSVVNGVAWPSLEVEPDLYRFRLLNGANSRFINLSMVALDANGDIIGTVDGKRYEVPFYMIGAEQSVLPKVVKIVRGKRKRLKGDGVNPRLVPRRLPNLNRDTSEERFEGLLLGPAERADVIVDFSDLPQGTVAVRMLNTAPDAPFGGFPDIIADPATTGQVMQFTLVPDTAVGEDATHPADLKLSLPDRRDPANTKNTFANPRDLALLEEESKLVCVNTLLDGTIEWDSDAVPDPNEPGTCIGDQSGVLATSVPFGPQSAVLGTNGAGGGTVQLWSDAIEQNPALGATETWELYNWSADAHPMHLHLVKFKVVNRECVDEAACRQGVLGQVDKPELTETGWKDTVIAYPGEVTRLNATFDIAGLYVWHCHIVEHEDNEMMVPYCVGPRGSAPGCNVVP